MVRAAVRERPTARRRASFWAGIALILGGLAIVGYVLWQFYGTNWVSHRHQRQAVHELRRGWGAGHSAVRTEFGKAQALIQIPRFGKGYEVPVFAGTSEQVLAAGYGHFKGTAGPGRIGNYALAAHRVTHGEPLRRMPELQKGDVIRVVTRRTTYVYRLTSGGDDLVVPFTDTWVTAALPHNPDGGVEPPQKRHERLITLTTCSELFHTDNRMVAFGVLAGRQRTRG